MKMVKITDLKTGDKFISKGSKLTFSQVRRETETTISVYCWQHIMSSYITIDFKKSELVELI